MHMHAVIPPFAMESTVVGRNVMPGNAVYPMRRQLHLARTLFAIFGLAPAFKRAFAISVNPLSLSAL
jgi:hypothetical protein